jgi:hypothetical protein
MTVATRDQSGHRTPRTALPNPSKANPWTGSPHRAVGETFRAVV